MSGYTILIVMAIMAGLAFAGFSVVPKGENQTVIRTMICLTITCCTVMWAITYLSQLHPLVSPKNSKLRSHSELSL